MFIPESIPLLSPQTILSMQYMSYPQLAQTILRYFVDLDEINEQDWTSIFHDLYKDFTSPVIEYQQLHDNIYISDLSLGPSLAFKDLGMQCLCSIMDFFLCRSSKRMTVLVGILYFTSLQFTLLYCTLLHLSITLQAHQEIPDPQQCMR